MGIFKREITYRRVLLTLVIFLVFVAGMIAGVVYDRSRAVLNLGKFWDTYQLIEKNYIGSIDKEKAEEGVIRGLVNSLEDPFSMYLDKEAKASLQEELSGELQGIGAELEMQDGLVTVVAPITSSPAEQSGIQSGDVIYQVNGESVEGMSLNSVVKLIRGEKGTKVKITILRTNEDAPLEFEITRDVIKIDSVTVSYKDSVAIITLSQFAADTANAFSKIAKEVAGKNVSAVVLDLRNNPGGYLNVVAPIAGNFLPPSVIVKEKFKGRSSQVIKSTETPILPTVPMYVLVNKGTASSSEILAGALQDYNRAKLVGSQTYGKGSVQDIIDLAGNTALRITIAEWLTPNDRAINKVGIKPDYEVAEQRTKEVDPALNKALELIKNGE